MKDEANPKNLGAVVSVRGSVVDTRFDPHLPPIYSVLRAGDKGQIVIEVLAQRNARDVRGIGLAPTQGLARGMTAEDAGGPLKAPVGKAILSRMFDVFGNAIDRRPAPAEVQSRSVHRAFEPIPARLFSQIFDTGSSPCRVLHLWVAGRGGSGGCQVQAIR